MRHSILLCALLGLLAIALNTQADEKEDKASTGKAAQSTENSEKESPKQRSSGTIRLQSTFVGDKEQPAISYFIPWQGVGTPDKLHWNMEERNDEALKPVDRDVMLRSIQLYEGLQLESSR